MKAQGVQSHDALAQEIAVSIIEKNDESPVISPSVQSPEEVRDTWTSTFNTPNNTPAPPPTLRIATASPETQKGLSTPISCSQDQLDDGPVAMSAQSEISSESQQTTPEDVMAVDNHDDINDEEARLVAELEAERLAEEKARQKRRKLEERLASARGRRVQSSTNLSEREGNEYQRNMFSRTQDSTSSLRE